METKEAFFSKLEPVLSPSELMNIEVAYALAKFGHRWQTRKELDDEGNPIRYFEHLKGTALILIDELAVYDSELIITALMHDSLEDTKDITAPMLEHLFGANVAKMVRLLTKNPKEGYYERLLNHGSGDLLMIKCCDRINNIRSLEKTELEFQLKQIKDTEKHFVYGFVGPTLITLSEKERNFKYSRAIGILKRDLQAVQNALQNKTR